jgi:hypothetical protein
MPRASPEFAIEPCAACLGRDPACDTCDGTGKVRRRLRPSRPARAKKPTPTPRSHAREGSRLVTFWATDEERDRWRDAAERDERPLSQWIRRTLDRAARP